LTPAPCLTRSNPKRLTLGAEKQVFDFERTLYLNYLFLERVDGGSGAGFQIEEIRRSADAITLSWPSVPGRLYSVEFSLAVEPLKWLELKELEAEATTTKFIDRDSKRLNTDGAWYRVRETN